MKSLTLLGAPAHLLGNLLEVRLCDLAARVLIEQLEDLGVDVVAGELSYVALLALTVTVLAQETVVACGRNLIFTSGHCISASILIR